MPTPCGYLQRIFRAMPEIYSQVSSHEALLPAKKFQPALQLNR